MHGQFAFSWHPRIRLPEEVIHVYFVSAVRVFISSSVAIFLPLYFYLRMHSAFAALSFVTLSFIFMGVALLLLAAILRNAVFEWLGLISTLFFVLLFAYVYSVPASWSAVVVSAILFGIAGGIYWFPHHLIYSLYGREKTSTAYGGEAVVNSVVSIVSPLISGLISAIFGFHVFFAVASLFSVSALFVWAAHLKHRTVLDFSRMRTFYRHIAWDRAILYIIGGAITVPMVILPVYLAVVGVKNATATIGWVYSLASLLGAFTSYLIGRYLDKEHDYALGAVGLAVYAFLLMNIVAFPQYSPYFLIFRGILGAVSFFPVMGWIYRLAAHNGGIEVFAREFFLMIGRFLVAFPLILYHPSVSAVVVAGAYLLVAYGIIFYYLSRIKYVEG
ncbi:MAG: MFS transporter [Candidatus Diapherotrites archaeon]|nr:MFS transporter [Candidatus Diapherotrites archaeon]